VRRVRVDIEGGEMSIVTDNDNANWRACIEMIQALRDENQALKFTAEEWERKYDYQVELNHYRMKMDQAELAALKAELAMANKRIHMLRADLFEVVEDRISEDIQPCPKCHGEVGHRINCPDGIAFSDWRRYSK
jgi:hypothetical protein